MTHGEARHEFTLLENGLDYVLSAAEYCRKQDGRSLKYAVLHLFAGIELLLKDRLRREHWTLIFSDVDRATRAHLEAGNFKSVDYSSLQSRLRDVAGVRIEDRHLRHIEALRQLRNQSQHFAVSFSLNEVRSQLVLGLSFVVEFCKEHLGEGAGHAKASLDAIHAELAYFDEFIAARLKQVSPQLEGKTLWLACPRCSQESMILGEGNPHCPFCGYSADPITAFFDVKGDQISTDCPKCNGPCPIFDTQGGGEAAICFKCGYGFQLS